MNHSTRPSNTNVDNITEISEIEQQRDRLKAEAAAMEDRLRVLRAENNEAGGKASRIVQNVRKSKALKTVKKFLGYTLVVGGVTLAGAYIYSRLRTAGVDVPDGDAVGDAVARAVDAATA
jgi:heme oxygenase